MLPIAVAFAIPALAQQPSAPPASAARPSAAAPSTARAAAPKARHAAAPKPPGAAPHGAHPTLLAQYAEWGAYTASPGGKKVCFALAKPAASQTIPPNRPRNPAYMFVSSRPADKVLHEVFIMIGYPFRPNAEATAEIGPTSFALSTLQDGAWIKNAGEEAHFVDAMRAGQTVVVKGMSSRGTQSVDTFSLKGFSQALERTDQECPHGQ